MVGMNTSETSDGNERTLYARPPSLVEGCSGCGEWQMPLVTQNERWRAQRRAEPLVASGSSSS